MHIVIIILTQLLIQLLRSTITSGGRRCITCGSCRSVSQCCTRTSDTTACHSRRGSTRLYSISLLLLCCDCSALRMSTAFTRITVSLMPLLWPLITLSSQLTTLTHNHKWQATSSGMTVQASRTTSTPQEYCLIWRGLCSRTQSYSTACASHFWRQSHC